MPRQLSLAAVVLIAFVAGAVTITFIEPMSIVQRLLGGEAYAQEGQMAMATGPDRTLDVVQGGGSGIWTDPLRRSPGQRSQYGQPEEGTDGPRLGNSSVEGTPPRQNPNINSRGQGAGTPRVLTNNGISSALFMALQDLMSVYGAINMSNDRPNPFKRIEPWGERPPGNNGEWASSIGAEGGPDGYLYVLHRCESVGGGRCTGSDVPPIIKLNPKTGESVLTFGVGEMDDPHGFTVDGEGNVWATDTRSHQAVKFSSEGELLMRIGTRGEEGMPHVDGKLFQPTAIIVARNGDIFITEGHSKLGPNSRVSKFAPDGSFIKYLSQGAGSGPMQVSGPHALAIDTQGRLFVGDRDNNRVLIWTQDGDFIDMWHQFSRPSGIWIDQHDRIHVADSESWGPDNMGWRKGIRIGSAVTGQVEYFLEDIESRDFSHSGAEGMGVDAYGNIYGTTNRRQSIERHEPPEVRPSWQAAWPAPSGAWPPF